METSDAADRKEAPPPDSHLRTFGRLLFFGGLLFAFCSALIEGSAATAPARAAAEGFASLCSYAAGAGFLMWLIGILERRLIEIREILRGLARPK